MSRHEQAVIDRFNLFMKAQAGTRRQRYGYIALDGQDRHVLADYILTNESTFTLVEFKYTQSERRDEGRKHRSLTLCSHLERDNEMRALHDLCHFVAWMQVPDYRPHLNIYRHEICNCEVFGLECGLKSKAPSSTTRVDAREFARSFFDEPSARTLSIDEFDIYVEWLFGRLDGSGASTLELLVGDDDSANCDFIAFPSVRSLYEWFQDRRPTMNQTPTPSSGPDW